MSLPVSVIIPSYNRAELLAEAVTSVLQQNSRCRELICIDDGSTDQTAEFIAGLAPERGVRVVYCRQENLGAAAARNRGIAVASCEYLAFLDSDDLWRSAKLQRQYRWMRQNPWALVCHTRERWLRRGRHLNQKKRHLPRGGDIFLQSLKLCAVGMSTVMIRKELFELVGLFDETFPCCEDYELWLRVSARFPFLLLEEPLTIKRGGRDDQLSTRYAIGMDRFRIRAMEKLLADSNLAGWQRQATMAELMRKLLIYGNGCLRHNRQDEGEQCLVRARELSCLLEQSDDQAIMA